MRDKSPIQQIAPVGMCVAINYSLYRKENVFIMGYWDFDLGSYYVKKLFKLYSASFSIPIEFFYNSISQLKLNIGLSTVLVAEVPIQEPISAYLIYSRKTGMGHLLAQVSLAQAQSALLEQSIKIKYGFLSQIPNLDLSAQAKDIYYSLPIPTHHYTKSKSIISIQILTKMTFSGPRLNLLMTKYHTMFISRYKHNLTSTVLPKVQSRRLESPSFNKRFKGYHPLHEAKPEGNYIKSR